MVVSVFGRKGSGKTTLVRELAASYDRRIAFDTLGEYGQADGWTVVHDFEGALTLMSAPPARFAWSIRLSEIADYFDLFELAFEIPNTLLLFEESSLFCSASYLPDQLSKLVRYGRHRNIDMVFVSRRPSEVNRDVTAQSDLIVTFRQHEPRDLMYLAAVSGANVDHVRTLGDYRVAVIQGDATDAPPAVQSRMQGPAQLELPLTPKGGRR